MSTSCSPEFCPSPNIEWNKPIKIECGNGQINNTPRSRLITSINGGVGTDLQWLDVVQDCAGTDQFPQGSCPYYTGSTVAKNSGSNKTWCGNPGSAEPCMNNDTHCWKAGLVWSNKPSHAWFFSPSQTDGKDGYNDADLRVTQLTTKNCLCSTGNQKCPGCTEISNAQNIGNCCVNDPNPANSFENNGDSGTSNMGACRFGFSAGSLINYGNGDTYSGCTMLESSLADTANRWNYVNSSPANPKPLTSSACQALNTPQGVTCTFTNNQCVCSSENMNSVVCNNVAVANRNNSVLCSYDPNAQKPQCVCVNASKMMPGYLVSAVHSNNVANNIYQGFILGDQSSKVAGQTYQNNFCAGGGSTSSQSSIYDGCNNYYQSAYIQGTNLGHIDIENAVKCCSLGSTDIANNVASGWAQYPLCQAAFNPGGSGNKCQPLMTAFCENYWNSQDPEIAKVCANFIQVSPVGPSSAEQMLITYLNSRTGCSATNTGACPVNGMCSNGKKAQPVDYVSPALANPNGTSAQRVAYQYYKDNNGCGYPNTAPGTCVPICKYDGTDQPGCLRDDSINPFFTKTIVQLVNDAKSNNSAGNPQSCDNILQAFCQSMTREDINADMASGSMTLMEMCGCHLKPISGPVTTPTSPLQMCPITATPPSTSPYYTNTAGGQACDPLCLNAYIQNCMYNTDISDKCACTAQQCIIDNVTINEINSDPGSIGLYQDCNGGQCYISDVTVNVINSGVSDGINMFQHCGSCYTFTGGNLSNAQQIDCNTLQPTVVNPPSPPSSQSFYQKHKLVVWIAIIILIIVVVGFIIYFLNKKPDTSSSSDIPSVLQNYFDEA